ncbi:AAA family ATPase, partial [Candidatus Pacearchaeota archaeon]|nr:AAA family ATPase [Candidatus Pacearchaeota archaeon]MBD3283037.1 AAA family ATPase [Candidatus Pacearchaeota archaeon]
MLLIFFGQIGTGKSTLAREVAKKLSYEFINFDNIMWLAVNKKKMYSDKDDFLLSIEEIQKVYDSMHVIAKFLLQNKRNTVIESMYFKK